MESLIQRLLARAGIASLLVALSSPGTAAGPVPSSDIKAAFVYNFLKYTEWPEDGDKGPIQLCLVNADKAVETAFADIDGRSIKGRPVRVQRYGLSGELGGCHLVFYNDGEARLLLERSHAPSPYSLTVGDAVGFVDAGGMIGLIEQGGRLQFEVNLDATRRSSVRLSAQLLKLARNVRDTGAR